MSYLLLLRERLSRLDRSAIARSFSSRCLRRDSVIASQVIASSGQRS
ncbi:hypothetical protein [Microcella sp.]